MARWEPNGRWRLVEAALELFEEQGYDATSVVQIADRAGLTKTTFFRHFPDKREVLFAGEAEHDALLARAVAEAPAGASTLAATKAALVALAGSVQDRQAFAARLQRVIGAEPELRERAAHKSASYQAAMAGALRERGVGEPEASIAAQLGVMAFGSTFARWAAAGTPEPLADLVGPALDELHAAAAALA